MGDINRIRLIRNNRNRRLTWESDSFLETLFQVIGGNQQDDRTNAWNRGFTSLKGNNK